MNISFVNKIAVEGSCIKFADLQNSKLVSPIAKTPVIKQHSKPALKNINGFVKKIFEFNVYKSIKEHFFAV